MAIRRIVGTHGYPILSQPSYAIPSPLGCVDIAYVYTGPQPPKRQTSGAIASGASASGLVESQSQSQAKLTPHLGTNCVEMYLLCA